MNTGLDWNQYELGPPGELEKTIQWGVWLQTLARLVVLTLGGSVLAALWSPAAWVLLFVAGCFALGTAGLFLTTLLHRLRLRGRSDEEIVGRLPLPPVAGGGLGLLTVLLTAAGPILLGFLLAPPGVSRWSLFLFGGAFCLLGITILTRPEATILGEGLLHRSRLFPWSDFDRVESESGAIILKRPDDSELRLSKEGLPETCDLSRTMEHLIRESTNE